jgi:hypothetical protein
VLAVRTQWSLLSLIESATFNSYFICTENNMDDPAYASVAKDYQGQYNIAYNTK